MKSPLREISLKPHLDVVLQTREGARLAGKYHPLAERQSKIFLFLRKKRDELSGGNLSIPSLLGKGSSIETEPQEAGIMAPEWPHTVSSGQ